MKKLMTIVATALVMVGCNNAKTYVVEGQIEGLTGEVAIMDINATETLATATAEEGKFLLTVESQMPMFAALAIDGNTVLPVFLDGSPIQVSGNVEMLEELAATGTTANDAFAEFNKVQRELIEPLYSGEASEDDFVNIITRMQEYIQESYEANKTNLWGAYLFVSNKYHELSANEILDVIANFPKEIQKVSEIETIKGYAENMLKTAVGQSYIDIALPNVEGEEVSLKSVVEANKVVLLDFWASWCRPCMGEMPFLLDAYAKFHSKGFEIYGVSLDESAEAWRSTIDKQGMKWVNVSEVAGWNTPAAKEYSVNSIPANFLIDSEGKIIAKNLRGEALIEKLVELFQ